MAPSSRSSQNLGQVIEYIPGTFPSIPFISTRLLLHLTLLSSSSHSCTFLFCPLPVEQATSMLTSFLADRLYLAAYTHQPTADTPFPYPQAPTSPRKRAAQQQAASARRSPCYFTVDDTLLYNAFHHDFGPLHIGHLYRFAIQFHDILGAKENKDRPIVFWSHADPRSRFPSKARPVACSANSNQ